MKKIKIISFMVIVMIMFNAIAISCISNAAETASKIIKPSTYNPYNLLVIYAKSGAGLGVEQFNKDVEQYLVNIDSIVDEEDEEIIKCDDGKIDHALYNFNDLADGEISLIDQGYLLNYHSIFMVGDNNHDLYKATKKYCELKFGTLSSFSMQMKIIGNNGKKLTAVIDDSNSNSFKYQYNVENIKNVHEKIISELGGTISADKNYELPEDLYDRLQEQNLFKSMNIIFKVNGKNYYFVYGYNSEKIKEEENPDKVGYYKTNAYLITDKTADDDDNTEFDTTLDYKAVILNKEISGEIKENTFIPSYDPQNIKEDADVTAIIKSKDEKIIYTVNDVKLNEDGSENELHWYYPDVDDKTTIAKLYPFEKYDNSTYNGMTGKEPVELGSEDGQKSNQTVSIKWPFRIIEKTQEPDKIDENTEKVTVTITTNLPMDPNKVPDGWEIIDGTDNHKIKKTYKREKNINEDVTVYQNVTGDTDTANIKITWPEKLPTIFPQTGETTGYIVVGIVALLGVIFVIRRKMKLNDYKK